jgi:16S rRNA (uracil1498-N3)-methyltransferase
MSSVPPRFYAPDLHADRDSVVLTGDEAMHLTRVLRLGAGAVVRAFDGRGLEREALVELVGKREVVLRVGTRVDSARELSFSLTLVQSVLKGDAFDGIVRDATMLGVTAIQPVVATRSEITAAAMERGRRVERWTRIAISSAKQCRRAVVPEIRNPLSFSAALAAYAGAASRQLDEDPEPNVGAAFRRPNTVLTPSGFKPVAVMLVEPAAPVPSAELSALATIAPQSGVVVFVGPEGGWAEAEIAEAASAGMKLVTVGDRTLRADAAALVALPVLLYLWGEL